MKLRLPIRTGMLKAGARRITGKIKQYRKQMRTWAKRKAAERKRKRLQKKFELERKPLLVRWGRHAQSFGNLEQAAEYFAEAGEIEMLRDVLKQWNARRIITAREKSGDVLKDLNRARMQMHAIKGLNKHALLYNGRHQRFELELKYAFGKLANLIRRKLGSDLTDPAKAKQIRELGMMYAELARHPEGEKYKKRAMEVVYALYQTGCERARQIPKAQPGTVPERDRRQVLAHRINLPRTYAIEIAHMLDVTLRDVIDVFE